VLKRGLVYLVLFGLVTLPVLGESQIVLRAADVHVRSYPTVQALLLMAEYVEARSGGRIRIEVYEGGQLGDERSTIEQVRAGILDIVRTATGPVEAFYPYIGVFSLPYIFRSETHMWSVLQGPLGRWLLDDMASAGFIGLAYLDAGARHFYTTKKPITKPEDLVGLKIRVRQTEIEIAMVEALGAIPVAMAFGEVYTALQTGVIDGAENNEPSYGPYGVRHYEVAKYLTLDGHLRNPEVILISKATWDRLSPEDRVLLREAALAAATYQASLWDDYVQKTMVELRKPESGVTIIEVDVSAFQAAMSPVYARFRNRFDTPIGNLIDLIINTPELRP